MYGTYRDIITGKIMFTAPLSTLNTIVLFFSIVVVCKAAPFEHETEYKHAEHSSKDNFAVESFLPLNLPSNQTKDYDTESYSPERTNIAEVEILDMLSKNKTQPASFDKKSTIDDTEKQDNLFEDKTENVSINKDNGNSEVRKPEELVLLKTNLNEIYCQESLGLTYDAVTSNGVYVLTPEGNASDVLLHAPTMWSMDTNNGEAWVLVRFEGEILITGFTVRHDISYGQRAKELHFMWGENCEDIINSTNYQEQNYTIVFDEASEAPSIITMQLDDPLITRCLMIYPYGDQNQEEPLALQIDLLGCGATDCRRRIHADIVSTDESDCLTVDLGSEKLVTDLTFQIVTDVNVTTNFSGTSTVQIFTSRTCRTFYNISDSEISFQNHIEVKSGATSTQISVALSQPMRLQCIKLVANENATSSYVEGKMEATGCAVWKADRGECGWTNFDLHREHSRQKRVIGGQSLSRVQWPWLVSLQFSDFHPFRNHTEHYFAHLCGASLISPTWVLTAAHCLSNTSYRGLDEADKWTVVLGEHALQTPEETTEEYEIETLILHENYSNKFPIRNDIALIKLAEAVPMSSYARTVCLDDVGDIDTEDECYVTGWGAIYGNYSYGANNVPLHAKVPVITTEMCRQKYYDIPDSHPAKKFALLDDGVICTLADDGGTDSCWGDSGGPLLCLRGDKWTQVGLAFGGYKCGHKDYPGVYTRIKHFKQWIETTIAEN